jgi:vancomycin resistance protein YoaR
VVVAFLGTLTATGIWLDAEYLPEGQALRGTTLAGLEQGKDESLEAWLGRVEGEVGGRKVALDLGDSTLEASVAALGGRIDRARTQEVLLEQATSGGYFQRFERALCARRGEAHVTPVSTFDAERAREFLTTLAPSVARDPEDARVDLLNHRKIPDRPGRELDVEASVAAVEGALSQGENRILLKLRELPAEVRLESLIDVDVSQVLAAFETDFKGHAGQRKINIERAVKYLNGTILEPGKRFSFNKTVGERSEIRGFVNAPVIIDDIMESGIGGGVCQVASTLFAAAVYGDLTILHRRSHSRPSGYAPLGLDATVIDHEVDLRFKNPYDVPLLIHAFLPTEFTVRVELLGYAPGKKVEHEYGVSERYDFVRRVKYTSEVKAPKRKQKGHYGYDVTSLVKVVEPDGTKENRTYPSKYYPVPEVYWVPPDYDLAKLPPLPEGATETVVVDDTKPDANDPAEENRLAEPPS